MNLRIFFAVLAACLPQAPRNRSTERPAVDLYARVPVGTKMIVQQ